MVRTLKFLTLAGAVALTGAFSVAPASAAFITLPFIGDIEHPDMDPFHLVTPEPAAAPEKAAAPMKKKHKKKKMKAM